MSDDPVMRELRAWESIEAPVDLGLVPNATDNATIADMELAEMVAIVPCTCRACAEWESWHDACGEERPDFGTCLYLSGLRNPLDTMWLLNNNTVRTLPDFGCNHWRAKEAT